MPSNNPSWFVIVNPHSGGSNKWEATERELNKQDVSYTAITTQHKQDVENLIKEAIKKGYHKFIAVGGDGSSNILINALMRNNALASRDLIFANLTCGTGNDWQRGRKWPKPIADQVRLIKANIVEPMDLGVVSYPEGQEMKYYFHNMLGLAYDAYVVHNLSLGNKNKIGPLIYILSVLRYIFQFEIPTLQIAFKDNYLNQKMYTFNIGLGTHAGSGMQICPHAKDRKDQFAILVAYQMSKVRVLLESIRFYTGTIHKSSKTAIYFAKKIRASSSAIPMQVEADGEVFPSGPIDVEIINNAILTIGFNKIL